MVWWSLSLVMLRVKNGGEELPVCWRKMQMLHRLGLSSCGHRAGTELWSWACRQNMVTGKAWCWSCQLVTRESSALKDFTFLHYCECDTCAVTFTCWSYTLWVLVWIMCWGLPNKIILLILLLDLKKVLLIRWWCLRTVTETSLRSNNSLLLKWDDLARPIIHPSLCSVLLLLISWELVGPFCNLTLPVNWQETARSG